MDPTSAEFFQPDPVQHIPRGSRASIRFETRAVEHPGLTAESGRKRYHNVDFIYIRNPGSKDEHCKRTKEITDPWEKQLYDHWRSTQEQPSDGTALNMVPWLDPSQVAELQAIGVKSLEQLAELPDVALTKGGMHGVLNLRKTAQSYLKAADDTKLVTRLEGDLADRDRRIEDLQRQITEMGEKFDAMTKGKKAA